jgi:hypothetical protein
VSAGGALAHWYPAAWLSCAGKISSNLPSLGRVNITTPEFGFHDEERAPPISVHEEDAQGFCRHGGLTFIIAQSLEVLFRI